MGQTGRIGLAGLAATLAARSLVFAAALLLTATSPARAEIRPTPALSPSLLSPSPLSPSLLWPPYAGPPSAPAVGTGSAASPFHLVADAATRERARGCLASAIYYEAADQPRPGREAVAQVVLNRVRHPNYPKSVCGVVYQGAPRPGCQFTFACDGALARAPQPRAWREALEIADRALDGFVAAEVGASTHYHALWVRPAWSAALRPTLRIAAHQFYRLPGGLGEAAALTGVYAGAEPAIDLHVAGAAPTARLRLASARAMARSGAEAGLAAPLPADFSVWGLTIARVTPRRSGAIVVAPAWIAGRPEPGAETPAAGSGSSAADAGPPGAAPEAFGS